MEIISLKPFGYCVGVSNAISLILKEKEEHPNDEIFLLGLPVHNEEVVNTLKEKNIHLIDEKTIDLEKALEEIKEGSTVIFSAHGHPKKYEEIAKRRNLKIVDTTCKFVNENLLYAIKENKDVIYIGKATHLETMAFLANYPSSFYDVNSKKLVLKEGIKDPLIISQTTLTEKEIEEGEKEIYSIFPNPIKGKERCFSTKLRQDAIKNLDRKSVDYVLVLGSKLSSNSLALYSLALSLGFEAYICLNLEEVKKIKFDKNKKIALTSGASTSQATFNEVYNYLKEI
ncbi:MAG: hypothetical protein SPL02_01730 [Bacilli bacterium]|nr:hypothetical protein [Bacilli bacterium]MDY6430679.1 hypothetical protein [Bacilli bacterium]